jgi:SAM-dependent methyltransferase
LKHAYKCQVCSANALETFESYRSLPRVTSDAKPWPAGGELAVCHVCGGIQKLPTKQWQDEAARIYRDYEMYHLSQGAEQLVFADVGEAKPRSQKLVEFVFASASLPANGKLLDIGCGNGEAIGNFSHVLPNWKLYGCELTDKVLPELQRLPNFAKLYTIPPADIEERCTIVSMIHALEHMPVPLETVADAVRLLEEEGMLFIEVPDVETSPFDLLVADHMVHFSRETLHALATRAGVQVITLRNDLAPKENTLLGRHGTPTNIPLQPESGVRIARETVAWLTRVVEQITDLTKRGPIAIFGTSVAGMALYGAFREKVSFFVDEDPARIGKHYDGRLIVSPTQAERDVPVIMALPPSRAEKAATRLAGVGIQAVCPPPLALN